MVLTTKQENTIGQRPNRAAFLYVACLLLASPLWFVHDALGEIPALDRVRVLPSPIPVKDTELIDQNGEPFQLSDLHGRVAFVFFGFTNCPDVCPLAMQRLRALHASDELDLGDVAYVLISVDGERDTPTQMRAFLEEYSADFIGLTAKPDVVRPVAKSFSAPFFKGHEDHGGGYEVTHSPQIFVLDQKGRLRAETYNAPIESMVGTANALLKEEA